MSTLNQLFTTIWVAAICFVCIIILFNIIYQLCIRDSSEWIDKTYRNLTIAIILSFTASTNTDLIHIVLSNYVFPSNLPLMDKKGIVLCADASSFVGDIMFYMLVLMRIAIPFDVNLCMFRILTLSISIFVLASITYCLGLYLFYDSDFWFDVVLIVLMINDFALNVIIFIVFTIKMKNMISDVDPTLSDAIQRNVNLISTTVVKHCILFGIAMILNQAFYIMNVVGNTTNFLTQTWWTNLVYSVRALENVVNVLVLWLVLRVNYNRYIFLCGCCHKCIGKCCFKGSDTSTIIDNPYFELEDVAESNSRVLN